MTQSESDGINREDVRSAHLSTASSQARVTSANYAPSLRREFFSEIKSEVTRAYAKHGDDQWGRHEFYAILLEEVEEVWDAIKQDLPQEEVRAELLQVACVCLRYYETGDRYRETLRPAVGA